MKKIIILFIIIFSLFLSGFAVDSEEIIEKQIKIANESNILKPLSESSIEVLESIGMDEMNYENISEISLNDIIKIVFKKIVTEIKRPFVSIFTVAGAAIICAVIHSFCDGFSGTGKVVGAVSSLTAASAILIPMKNTIVSSVGIIDECSSFMLGFIPVYSSSVAASGYISSSVGFKTLMISAATIISRLANEIIVPLIMIYAAMCIVGAVSELNIEGISKSFKNTAIWFLTGSMTVFSCILGLGTIVSTSADNAFYKTAKFLIGSTVPIIGGSVSDAFSTVKGCMNITKNILGTYAIIIIMIIFLPSIINLGSWKICLSISSYIGNIFGNKTLSGLLSSASSVMGIMLALVILTCIMFIISISIMLLSGSGG